MAETKIEWTDRTWNPLRGCSMAKGSETGGCLNCYAARMAARNLPEMRSPSTGEAFALMRNAGPRWTGRVEWIESKLREPLRWRSPQRIFVNSMSDLFHEDLLFPDILRTIDVILEARQHTFQVLTKRPERMRAFFEWWGHPTPPNLWLGTSAENQRTADIRIPHLLAAAAGIHFVSYEPALGPIDFAAFAKGLDWIIIGGESGPGARPFDIAWVRSVIAQCECMGVSCFVKQLGACPIENGHPLRLRDRKGAEWSEWSPELRLRDMPVRG